MPPKRKRGGQPANANALRTGFYSPHFTEEELSRIAKYIADPSVDDEIFLLRTLNNRLMQHITDANEEHVKNALWVLSTSTGRIARLLRDKRVLSGETVDSLVGAVATALDELGAEWDRSDL